MSLFRKVVSSLIVAVLVFGGGEFLPSAKAATPQGTLAVSLAQSSISASTMPDGTDYNEVAIFEFAASPDADIYIDGLTFSFGGFFKKTAINHITLWDQNGKRHGGNLTSLTSDGKVTFAFGGDDGFWIPAGGTETVAVKISMSDDMDSGTINVGLISAADVVSTAMDITGDFPIVGATHSIVDASGSIGKYTVQWMSVGGGLPGNETLIYIGETREFLKFTVSNTSAAEDLQLERVYFSFYGDMNFPEALLRMETAKLRDEVGNILAEKMSTWDYGMVLTKPFLIAKGTSQTFTVEAEVSFQAESEETIHMNFQKNFDLFVKGMMSGAYLLDKTTLFPIPSFSAANWFKVGSGSLVISKSPASPAGFVAQGADNIVVAKYDLKASGEDIELQKLDFRVFKEIEPVKILSNNEYFRGTIKVALDGVTLYSIDAAAASTYTNDSPTSGVTLGSYATIQNGWTKSLTIESNIQTDAPCGTYFNTVVRGWAYRGLQSNAMMSSNQLFVGGNTLTVECSSLAVSPNGTFASGTLVTGTSNAKIGSFKLQAGGPETFNVSSITVKLKGLMDVSKFHNLMLKAGDKQYGASVGTPSQMGDMISTPGLSVLQNSMIVVDVYADIGSDIPSGSNVSVCIPQNGVIATGTISSMSFYAPPSEQCSATQTIITSGKLTIVDPANQVPQQVLHAGETDTDLFRFRMNVSNDEDVRLDKLNLTVTNGNGNVTNFKLVDGLGNQIGSTSTLVVPNMQEDKGTVQFSGLNKTLKKGEQQTFTVKGTVTSSGVLTPGKKVQFTVDQYEYTGVWSGYKTITTPSASVRSKLQIVHDVEPLMTVEGVSANAAPSTSQEVLKFKVKADGTRPLIVKSLEVMTTGSYAEASPWSQPKLFCSNGGNVIFVQRVGAPVDAYKIVKNGNKISIYSGGGMLLEVFGTVDQTFSGVSSAVGTLASPKSRYIWIGGQNCLGNILDGSVQMEIYSAGVTAFSVEINGDKKTVQGYVFGLNNRYHVVDLSTARMQSGLKLLFLFGTRPGLRFVPAPITIPVNTTATIVLKADTSSVKMNIVDKMVNFGLNIPGDAGQGRLTGGGAPINIYAKTGGLHWDYMNIKGVFGGSGTVVESQIDPAATWGWPNDNEIEPGSGATGLGTSFKQTIDVSDSYPVVGPTFTY